MDIAHEQLCIIAEPSDGDFADFLETDGIKDICCPEKVFIEEGKDEEDWDGSSSEGQEVHDPELSLSNWKNRLSVALCTCRRSKPSARPGSHGRIWCNERSLIGPRGTAGARDLKLNECAHDFQCLYPQGI